MVTVLPLVLLTSFLVVFAGEVQFSCHQGSTKWIGLASFCSSEDAFLCQAVLDASLSIECWRCPDGIPVNWTVTNSSGQQVELNMADKTLNLTASEVISMGAGCYQCECEEAGKPFGVNFSVTVERGAKPNFTVQVDTERDNNMYKLSPHLQRVTLDASVSGEAVVNCSATGYPDPTYSWQLNGKDINDSCIRVVDGGKQLIFVPTPWNTKDRKTYEFSCTVQNGLPDGTIIGEQMVRFEDIKEWLLHPHPGQSDSVLHLSDGSATGVVAACDYYTFGIEYLICANMTAVTPMDNPACSVDLYINEGKCCNCTIAPCHVGLDLKMSGITVTDNEGLGLDANGCNFTTSTKQRLLFFAKRHLGRTPMHVVYQLIGITDVESAPLPATGLDGTVVGGTVGSVVGALLFGTGFFLFAVGVGYIVNKRRYPKPVSGPVPIVAAVANSATQGRHLAPRTDIPYFKVPDTSMDDPAPSGHGTLPYECDSDTQERVRCIHKEFVEGVNIDPTVLAAMYANKVVNKHQNGKIHSMHMRSEPQDDIAAYFANCVLDNWPDAIFQQQVQMLVKVLRTATDDAANRSVAEKLSKAMSFETSADFCQSCR